MIKICTNNHITGYNNCPRCNANAFPFDREGPQRVGMDKREKRRITQAIRVAGGTPVVDMRHV